MQPMNSVLRLKLLRELHPEPLTQEQLASLTGLSRRYLQDLETATKLPRSLDAAVRLAFALQVTLEELVEPVTFRRVGLELSGRRATGFAP